MVNIVAWIKGRSPEERYFDGARKGNLKAVGALLASGAPVDTADRYGRTALFLALKYDHVHIAQALLEAGADPNHRMPNGKTPIFQAIRHGSLGGVRLLVERGADLTLRDEGGDTPYLYAKALARFQICQELEKAAAP